jgi:hypothetical protein
MTVHVEITGHSGFTTPPTVVVPQPTQQTQPQGVPTRPTLRLVR